MHPVELPLFSGTPDAPSLTSPSRFLDHVGARLSPPEGWCPPTICLVAFTPSFESLFLGSEGVERGPALHGVRLLRYQGRSLAVARFAIGGPASVMWLEEVRGLGFRRYLALGSAGGLNPSDPLGSAFLIERAVRDEGTSFHYAAPSPLVEAPIEPLGALRRFAQDQGIRLEAATSWTTDAPYRETNAKRSAFMEKYSARVVEMEAASVFAAARFHGLDWASIVLVSDHLDESGWRPGFRSPELKRRAAEWATRLIDIAVRLD